MNLKYKSESKAKPIPDSDSEQNKKGAHIHRGKIQNPYRSYSESGFSRNPDYSKKTTTHTTHYVIQFETPGISSFAPVLAEE